MIKAKDGTIVNVFPTNNDMVDLEIIDPFGMEIRFSITRTDALILGSGITHLGHGGQ